MIAFTDLSSLPHYKKVPKDILGNLRARRALRLEARHDKALQRRLKKMCAEDPLFYINMFVWTYTILDEPNEQPFITYDYQDEGTLRLLHHIRVQRPINFKKSRHMGWSWDALATCDWLGRFHRLQSMGGMSWKEDYVDKTGSTDSLFYKMDFIHERLPPWLRGERIRNSMHIEWCETRSVFDGETANPNAFRAGRRVVIVWDEPTSTPNAFAVAQGMAKATGCMARIYTPKGSSTEPASLERAGVYTHKSHWTIHPLHTRGLYRVEKGRAVVIDKRRFITYDSDGRAIQFPDEYKFIVDGPTVKEGQLRSPWYDQSCRELHWIPALIAAELDMSDEESSSQFFDPAFLDRAAREYCTSPLAVGRLDYALDSCVPKEFIYQDNGTLRLWCALPFGSPMIDRTYTIGADSSQGRGASNSTMAVTDDRMREKVGEYANPFTMPHEFARELAAVGRFFKGADQMPAKIIVERNGPGDTVIKCLQELGYENLWFPAGETEVPGWSPTKWSKMSLLGEYRGAQMEAKYIDRSEECVKEQRQYVILPNQTVEYSDTRGMIDPSGAGANHGDRVMATALSYLGSKSRADDPQPRAAAYEENTRGWRNEQREKARRDAEKDTYWQRDVA